MDFDRRTLSLGGDALLYGLAGEDESVIRADNVAMEVHIIL